VDRQPKGADGATAETRAILAKIEFLLVEAGLLQVQIWHADIRHYDEMNAVRDA
jgi:enamine deaminase RidA (YjgF/YER057c/UK114 family)